MKRVHNMVSFILNNQEIRTNKPTGSLLLDFIRYEQRLTGTKIGCREGDCGACTVLIGSLKGEKIQYVQATSCLTPIGNVHGKHVVTVEGLNMDHLSPAQQFIVEEGGTQCGFCTVGFVLSFTAFCLEAEAPTYEGAIAAIDGNICRCTGYKSLERAAEKLCHALEEKDLAQPVSWLVDRSFIPAWFKDIPHRLRALPLLAPAAQNGLWVGGGTDLYVQKHDELIDRNVGLVDQMDDMRFVSVREHSCRLGAASTVRDMQDSADLQKLFPRLDEHIKLVSSSPIRNISTLAGNLVNASPIGDLTIFFLALDASIGLKSKKGNQRSILLKEFYQGYKVLAKSPDEMLTEISFEIPTSSAKFNFEKVSKRIHLDIATVNSAALIQLEENHIQEVHISAGGVGPIPMYLEKTCAFLRGQILSPNVIIEATTVLELEISPISDVRGSAAYKSLLLRQLFFAHFVKLFPAHISLNSLV